MPAANAIQPVFLLSLPRSGSTLLQRILASHEAIHTTAEPWILLPLLSPLTDTRTYAEYGYQDYSNAIHDLWAELPHGQNSYLQHIRKLATNIYHDLSPEKTRYFLDKTPRYALIVSELLSTFPNARFICLWRNPLAIAGSMLRTWCNEKWKLYQFEVDLYEGLGNLLKAAQTHADRIHTIRYEDLVASPANRIGDLCDFLTIPRAESMLRVFNDVSFRGGKGDHVGTKRYTSVSEDSVAAWPSRLNSPIRRRWAKKYLEWIGDKRLKVMGYDRNILLSELEATPTSLTRLPADLFYSIYGVAYRSLALNVVRANLAARRRHKRVFGIY